MNHNQDLDALLLLPTLQKRHLHVQTSYGLIVNASKDGISNVRLAEDDSKTTAASSPTSSSHVTKPGYKYYIWPDYQTSFVWYVRDWAGNPEGTNNVEEDELEGRYSERWCAARRDWVDKYTQSFEEHGCQLGSGKSPLPDPEERVAWLLEGMLLASWLTLQPDVGAVSYEPALHAEKFLLKKQGLDNAFTRFLQPQSVSRDMNTDKTAAYAATAATVTKLEARKVAETDNENPMIQIETVINRVFCVV
ncbi:MAG: hypothetical protein M1836_004648 [Candelina mexicana]|nr:MAG: hypothetical protein M1836_004648 [Candelina mexicana]